MNELTPIKQAHKKLAHLKPSDFITPLVLVENRSYVKFRIDPALLTPAQMLEIFTVAYSLELEANMVALRGINRQLLTIEVSQTDLRGMEPSDLLKKTRERFAALNPSEFELEYDGKGNSFPCFYIFTRDTDKQDLINLFLDVNRMGLKAHHDLMNGETIIVIHQ